MTPASEYRRLRAKGWRAHEAWRAAKVNALWAVFEGEGEVKLHAEPWAECPSTLEPDWSGLYPDDVRARERAEKTWHETVEREGVWTIIGYYRDEDDDWIAVDSCGGFLGDDLKDNGYDTDIKAAVLSEMNVADESYGDIGRKGFWPDYAARAYSDSTMYLGALAEQCDNLEREASSRHGSD